MLAWLREDQLGGWFYHRRDIAPTRGNWKGGPPAGPLLADATTAVLLRNYASRGDDNDRSSRSRDQLLRVLAMGCADPTLIELDAEHIAAPGREGDLAAAIAQCDAAIANKPRRGDSGWASLMATRDLLAGRHDRIKERKKIEQDGTVVIERRHTPGAKAHRIRPLRFIRG